MELRRCPGSLSEGRRWVQACGPSGERQGRGARCQPEGAALSRADLSPSPAGAPRDNNEIAATLRGWGAASTRPSLPAGRRPPARPGRRAPTLRQLQLQLRQLRPHLGGQRGHRGRRRLQASLRHRGSASHTPEDERGPKEGRTDAGPHPGYRIRLQPLRASGAAAAAAAAMSWGHVSARPRPRPEDAPPRRCRTGVATAPSAAGLRERRMESSRLCQGNLQETHSTYLPNSKARNFLRGFCPTSSSLFRSLEHASVLFFPPLCLMATSLRGPATGHVHQLLNSTWQTFSFFFSYKL